MKELFQDGVLYMSVTVLVCIKSDSDDLIFFFLLFNVSLFKLLYLIYLLMCLRLVGVD